MAGTKDTEYLRISGYVKALENKLVSNEILDRIINAPDAGAALAVLAETGYGGADSASAQNPELEQMLLAERVSTYSFFEQNLPDRELVDIFRIPYDYLNLKICIKSELLGLSPDGMLAGGGRYLPEIFAEAVREGKGLSRPMHEAAAEAFDSASKTRNPQAVDFICDKACFGELSQYAERTGYGFVREYVAEKADIANISAFIRLRKSNSPPQLFSEAYVSARGCIDKGFFLEYYDKDFGSFVQALPSELSSCISGLADGDDIDLSAPDRCAAAMTERRIGKLRFTAFGPQVPFSYLMAKESEIRKVRIAVRGKYAGAGAETIRERLGMGHE